MGEAMLIRRGGGAVPSGLIVISPPDKLQYYIGETPDVDGAIIGAAFGTTILPLHESAWTFTPNRPLTAADTRLVFSATIGLVTRTASTPIVVGALDPVFDNNSWDMIAVAAQQGIADQLWGVGDIKTTAAGSFRIIGFNHDVLSGVDAKFDDASYNGGTRRAAITLQYVTKAGRDKMNKSATNVGGWLACYMNTTVLPGLLATLPSDMTDVMRTVDKYTCIGGDEANKRNQFNTAENRLFLLGGYEVYENPIGLAPIEASKCRQYAWYQSVENPQKGNPAYAEWLRSPHDPKYCDGSHFAAIDADGSLDAAHGPGLSCDYYPAFCI